ncbi:hypothetical protein SADUNF_Sadunf18G0042400 [Salix dunnii]|uniref:Pentatricopeptide repeat-containing protein n=1 Tax=Salix dunnii TaxID=1413687 RepID=A0A835J397_9ROSI|nr:hypothetical protein SADUNF_Sadunf18G0042400 [Salix dunnii]
MIDGYARKGENELPFFLSSSRYLLFIVFTVRKGELSLDVFEKMPSLDIISFTILGLLVSYGQLGNLQFGKVIHGWIEGRKHVISSNLILANALLDMYVKCQKVELALRSFSALKEKDVVSKGSQLPPHRLLDMGIPPGENKHEAPRINQDGAIFSLYRPLPYGPWSSNAPMKLCLDLITSRDSTLVRSIKDNFQRACRNPSNGVQSTDGLSSSIPSSAIPLSSVFIVRCRQVMALKLRYGHQGRYRYGGEKNEFEALRLSHKLLQTPLEMYMKSNDTPMNVLKSVLS